MTEPVIELDGVDKAYRFFQLSDIRLRLEAGQIMGFVGPNGAGKSTTIRILMGMIRPGSRHGARARARRCRTSRPRRSATSASSPRTCGCYGSDDARLAHEVRARRSTRAGTRRTPRRCSSASTCTPSRPSRHCRTASASRPALLLALARRPRLLLLDEPTTGLDPVARHEVLAELMDVVRDERRAILFSSHNTQDVEQISDVITFIDRGRIVDSSDKETFLDRWRRLHLDVPPGVALPALPGVVETIASGRPVVATTSAYSPGPGPRASTPGSGRPCATCSA